MPTHYLLSIDGGGVRGVIPLSLLVKLEQTTGCLARETFSFVAGTSTGAIIAAGLAAGLPAEKILSYYLSSAQRVFARRPWNSLRRLLFGYMYSNRTLYKLVANDLGVAGKWRLNDAPIDLLLTAVRVTDGMPWYFVRDNPSNSGRTGHLRLVDCVIASAAAPTYFHPWTIQESPKERRPGWKPVGTLVDGGVGVAGNPVYQACVEAFSYDSGYRPEETIVVSLGVGRFTTQANPTWLGSWLDWVLGQLLRSPGEQQTDLVQRHFPLEAFYRIDPDLNALDPSLTHDIGMDDVGSLDRLRDIGARFAEQVDWQAILKGESTPFSINSSNTLSYQYERP